MPIRYFSSETQAISMETGGASGREKWPCIFINKMYILEVIFLKYLLLPPTQLIVLYKLS